MNSKIFQLLTFCLCELVATSLQAQSKPILLDSKKVQLKEIGDLPKALKEASGLEITSSNHLWSHNDDGVPVLFCMDTLGNLIRTIHINRLNRGWEDLAQDDHGNIYVGGFGNNNNDKKDLKILKLSSLEKIGSEKMIESQDILYHYGDQLSYPPPPSKKNFDCDALISLGESLYLFTKDRTVPFKSYTKIYKLSSKPGQQTAELIDSLSLGKGYMLDRWITGADISPDKKTIAILFHDHIWLIRNFSEGKFSTGKIYEIDLNHYSHKAGICFMTNEKLYIVDELEMGMLGGKLYSLDLRPLLKNID